MPQLVQVEAHPYFPQAELKKMLAKMCIRDSVDGGALARPVHAEKGKERPLFDGERDVVDRPDVAVGFGEMFYRDVYKRQVSNASLRFI